jgi:hypothetical protein
MDGGNEQGVALKCSSKAGLSATETLVLVQNAYGNEDRNGSNVFRWWSRFRDGRDFVEVDERSGRTKSTGNEVNIAVLQICSKITSRMITEFLNIHKNIVLRILKEDLGKRMLCARCVPQCLTPGQREDRLTSCQYIIAMADSDKISLTKL